jgi:hypothetical protein
VLNIELQDKGLDFISKVKPSTSITFGCGITAIPLGKAALRSALLIYSQNQMIYPLIVPI